MLDTSRAEDSLAEARAFADRIGMREQLEAELQHLDEFAEDGDRGRTKCELYPDFAPYSLGFLMRLRRGDKYPVWFNGALLFHGPHDRGGDGAAPTYAVCLQPTVGWTCHT